jgi:hypothetical protein
MWRRTPFQSRVIIVTVELACWLPRVRVMCRICDKRRRAAQRKVAPWGTGKGGHSAESHVSTTRSPALARAGASGAYGPGLRDLAEFSGDPCRRTRVRLVREIRKRRACGGPNVTSHRRDAPLPEIAARVAGLGCRRSRFHWARSRPGPAASRDAATQLHRSWRQSLLERCQSVRQLSAEAAAPSDYRPGNPARDAASILPDAVHPECRVLRALSFGPHSECPRPEHVAAQPGGERRAAAPARLR